MSDIGSGSAELAAQRIGDYGVNTPLRLFPAPPTFEVNEQKYRPGSSQALKHCHQP
jgi:hypothetical protein